MTTEDYVKDMTKLPVPPTGTKYWLGVTRKEVSYLTWDDALARNDTILAVVQNKIIPGFQTVFQIYPDGRCFVILGNDYGFSVSRGDFDTIMEL